MKRTIISTLLVMFMMPAHASSWYIGMGAGLNWMPEMDQAGWNTDNICYPTSDCTGQDVEGYRWYYDLDADRGDIFEVTIGRQLGNLRLELSASHRDNDIDQDFVGITYLDESSTVPRNDERYTSKSVASIDDLKTDSVLLNVYYDFPLTKVTPYLGAGVGISYTKLSGLFFRSEYSCPEECSFYDSWQDEKLTDTVFSRHLYAGADYAISDRFLLGLKVTYSMVNDMSDTGRYIDHPIPDQLNNTRISDMNHWSLSLGLKYLFSR